MLRFPDGMRDKIADAAKAAGRSMNAEIVARLQASFEAPAAAPESLAAGLDKVLKELERLHDVNQQLLKLNTYPLDGSLDVSASDDPPTS
jgi:hypothetical protein